MIIQPRHFVRFIDGRAGPRITIAFLPGSLGAHIHALETSVFLQLDYARKLLRHGIRYEGFEYIQETIDNGMCLRDDWSRLRFLYMRGKVKPEIYFLLLKTAKAGREVWLVTFHRITRKQYADRIDRRKIIREHAEGEFMG